MKSINKLTISAIMAACAATSAYAVPATTKPIMVNQPDGTKIEVYLRGDERGSYFTTLDNVMISRGSNGCFYYTELGNDGKLVASSIRAHNEEERSFEEQAAVSMINGESLLGAFMQNRKLAASKAPSKTMDEGDLTKFPTIGSPRTVVILCEYQDVKFTFTNEDYYDMMNKENYTNDFGAVGSSKDYYMSCSNGQFTPIFDVVGPVTLSKNRMYYGEHTSSQIDIRPKAMIKEAIQLADEICDFSQYDYDGDGYVDNVFVYYAGVGEADSPVSEAIWPHKSELMTPVTCDGKKIVRYACHNELQYNEDEIPRMVGIGGFVH